MGVMLVSLIHNISTIMLVLLLSKVGCKDHKTLRSRDHQHILVYHLQIYETSQYIQQIPAPIYTHNDKMGSLPSFFHLRPQTICGHSNTITTTFAANQYTCHQCSRATIYSHICAPIWSPIWSPPIWWAIQLHHYMIQNDSHNSKVQPIYARATTVKGRLQRS